VQLDVASCTCLVTTRQGGFGRQKGRTSAQTAGRLHARRSRCYDGEAPDLFDDAEEATRLCGAPQSGSDMARPLADVEGGSSSKGYGASYVAADRTGAGTATANRLPAEVAGFGREMGRGSSPTTGVTPEI
jgi:hypothetical protein